MWDVALGENQNAVAVSSNKRAAQHTCDPLLYPRASSRARPQRPQRTSGPALFAAWSHQPVNTLDGLGARHRRRTHFAVAALLLRDGLTVEGAAGNVVDIGLHFAVVWRNACGEHPRRGLVVFVEALCCHHLACNVQSGRVYEWGWCAVLGFAMVWCLARLSLRQQTTSNQ